MVWKETTEGYETVMTFQKYGRAKEAVDTLLDETNGVLFASICYRRKEKPSAYCLFLAKEYLQDREYRYDGQNFVAITPVRESVFLLPGLYGLWAGNDVYTEQYIYNIQKRDASGDYSGRYQPRDKKSDQTVYAFEADGPYYTWEYWTAHFGTDEEKRLLQQIAERMRREARD